MDPPAAITARLGRTTTARALAGFLDDPYRGTSRGSLKDAGVPRAPLASRVRQRSGNLITACVHDLRLHHSVHEAVSRFFELGLTTPEVALISGHRDPRMLFRYTHLRPEDIAKKLARTPA